MSRDTVQPNSAQPGDDTSTIDALANMRILIGPTDTATFPSRLARGLAERGARCWVLNLSPHPYNADVKSFGKAKLFAAGCVKLITKLEQQQLPGRIGAALLKEAMRLAVFFWSLWAVNAVVFVSSRSIFRTNLDLYFYRLLGKRVVRVFLGSDSRPRYMSGWHPKLLEEKTREKAAKKLARRVQRQNKRVRRVSKWSSVVIDNPLCGHYQSKRFVNWFRIGFPHDETVFGRKPDASATPSQNKAEPLRVLHCPSNPRIKGTQRIDAAVQKLIDEGMPIEYTRITGMPHAQVLKHLENCDVVIDQMYSDSPMAGFASEAAAFGKPAIVCGYGWDLLRQSIPESAFPPNLLMNPDKFEAELPRVLADADNNRNVGQQAYDFMNSQWSQDAVIKRFAKVLTSDQTIPEDWWLNPSDITYWQGLGASQDHRKQVLLAFAEEQTTDALMASPESPFVQTIQSWMANKISK